ncbi:MAG: prephenate dehydrogenase/arogenate dehydrogenase family protein [FCB group bacterium]|jgi:prephenate dehydrogenase|nr:prephenate dehydrogenase/arogenate dehydrogenase family protein [FCB group bacterium]
MAENTEATAPHFGVVTVVGVGLLGGSLGLALKQRNLATRIRGVGRNVSTLETAQRLGAIDDIFTDLCEAAQGADLIVLCTPVVAVNDKLDELRGCVGPNAVVTDVASTKAEICRHAEDTWPHPLRFIGSHPMAGSEKFGPEHATPALYEGSVTLVARCPETDPGALDTVRALWYAVGSRVVDMDPQIHDALLARTSHIPHIVAACIAELAANAGDVKDVVGNGFRDVTRIAAGRPELWRDICLTNRDAILEGLLRLGERLDEVRRMIANNATHELEEFFKTGEESRREALGEK